MPGNEAVYSLETLSLASILDIIEEKSPFRNADITGMKAMCFDLGAAEKYLGLKTTQAIMSAFCPSFQIEVYGRGNANPNREVHHAKFFPTQVRFVSHYTIIEAGGLPALLWYEPRHSLDDGISLPSQDGVMVVLTRPSQKLRELYAQFEALREG